MGTMIRLAREVLERFVAEHDRLQRRLDALPPDGPTYRDRARLLNAIDGTRQALDAFHAQNQANNDGNATIPTRAAFNAKLDAVAMARTRQALERAREPAAALRDSLALVLTHADFLAEFDALPAVDRFAFLSDLLVEADLILDIEAASAMRRVDPAALPPWLAVPPPILSDIGDDHVLAPARLGAVVDELPFEVVLEGDAFVARLRADAPSGSEAAIRGALNRPTGGLEMLLWDLVRQFGNFMTLSVPVLAAATSRTYADQVLRSLYQKVDPMLQISGTGPADLEQALSTRASDLRQRDHDLYLRLGFPVSAAIGLVGIFLALRSMAEAATTQDAIRNGVTALLNGIELLRAGYEFVGRGGRFAWRLVGTVAGVALFVLDAYAASAGISGAVRYRDTSLAIGHAVQLGSSLALSSAGLAVLLGASATSGPLVVVIGVGVGLFLISEALIRWTRNTPVENFATVCMFGVNPVTSDSPGDLEYGFVRSGRAHVPTQLERLRTLLNPLGFSIGPSSPGYDAVAHLRPTAAGPSELRLPEATVFAVRLLQDDGSADDWVSTGTQPFSITEFRTTGSSLESSFGALGLRGKWMECEVRVPGAGDEMLREYARI